MHTKDHKASCLARDAVVHHLRLKKTSRTIHARNTLVLRNKTLTRCYTQVAIEVDRFFTMQEEGGGQAATDNAAMYLINRVIQSAADKQGVQVSSRSCHKCTHRPSVHIGVHIPTCDG
jgi:hypothetical protein